jgi:CHASE2 domain-containing sensor protein
MSDFLESAKSFVNSAVSRTGWEAQKQLRVRNKQSEIDKLLQQRQQLLGDLSQVAMTIYQQGTLSDPQLSRVCASIYELDHDLKTRETQLQEIKNEPYPMSQLTPEPVTNYAPPPISPSTPSDSSQTGVQGQAAQKCPQCGNPLRSNALYCRSCGTKLR